MFAFPPFAGNGDTFIAPRTTDLTISQRILGVYHPGKRHL